MTLQSVMVDSIIRINLDEAKRMKILPKPISLIYNMTRYQSELRQMIFYVNLRGFGIL